MKKTIYAHCVVRNEENFIWFSLMSVIKFVDKIIVFDLGSTDKTVEIIKTIKSDKIILHEMTANTDMIFHAKMRQRMIDENKSDWILVLDGDEVWLDESINKVVTTISQSSNIECIVVPTLMLVGDVYHYQEELAGDYYIAGQKGHFNLRAINYHIPGLHIEIHPNSQGFLREGYFDINNRLVYERSKEGIFLLNYPYLHASHLRRSHEDSKVVERSMRYKYEIGKKFGGDFTYPSVFYLSYPKQVPSPWRKPSLGYKVRSLIETPLKKIKRRVLSKKLC